MSISDFGTASVVCVEMGASLQYAAQLMKKHHVVGIVVVAGEGQMTPVGMITACGIIP